MKPVIITADDYALSEAVDAGILNLMRMRRVTATSCLTLSPRWPLAAQQITPDIRQLADIGLHLDFTQYAQVLKHPLPLLIAKTSLRLLSVSAIQSAIHMQLDAFELALGSPPDYVDGHQHVHQLPQIREVLVEVLSARYGRQMPWLRIAKPPRQDGVKAMIIGMLGANALRQLAIVHRVRFTDTLLGVYGFGLDAAHYTLKLNDWLATTNVSIKPLALMCHPAKQSDIMHAAEDAILSARFAEYAVFSGPHFANILQDHAVQLVRGHAIKH
jgi:predicted glycoside hydrolase/deacetylase ChbG (UPF0249 family)